MIAAALKLPIPPLMVRLPAVSGLLNVPVPLWIVRLPLTMLFAVLKVALPPVKSSGPVARYAPRMSVIPPAKRNTPLPATLEAVVSVDSVETPPANSSVPPAPIVKLPLLVPPPARLSVPLWMSTVPLLLKVTPEIDAYVRSAQQLSGAALSTEVAERFGVVLHRRTLERLRRT